MGEPRRKEGLQQSLLFEAKTFISNLISTEMNINTVRQYVGHEDERTTLRNYCFDRDSEEENLESNSKGFNEKRRRFRLLQVLVLDRGVERDSES